MDIPVGELSRRTQVRAPTIRDYEQTGLLPQSVRTEGQQRRGRSPRLSSGYRDIQFLALSADLDRPCADADEIASPGT